MTDMKWSTKLSWHCEPAIAHSEPLLRYFEPAGTCTACGSLGLSVMKLGTSLATEMQPAPSQEQCQADQIFLA